MALTTTTKESGGGGVADSSGCKEGEEAACPQSLAAQLPLSSVEDIEDVIGQQWRRPSAAGDNGGERIVKIHKKKRQRNNEDEGIEQIDYATTSPEDAEEVLSSNDTTPELHKIYVKTWGCSHNTSDSEYMAGLLAQAGYQVTTSKEDSARVWLLNSCTVKGPSEQHFKNEVEEALRLKKKVILAGCVPQGEPRSPYMKGLSVIGVKQIDQIVSVVEECLKGNTVRLLSFTKRDEQNENVLIKNPPGAILNMPKIRKNELIEIIPISTGCLNACTYCKTKLARGKLSSYPVEEITSRASSVLTNENVKEIWLTSEDLGAYGIDLGLNIIDLLSALVEVLPPETMLRLGMTNPPYILSHLEEMAKILNHPRVYSFLHIPIQSASDAVLLEMKREYSRKEFEKIVDFLKERVPNITIATDVICGFPTETEEDFQETLDLVKKYKFPVLYINQFYPRPGTVAAVKMKRIPTQIVKERSKKLTELFLSYNAFGDDRIGNQYEVLVTEMSNDGDHYVGHNKAYEQILIKKLENNDLMGKLVKVTIRRITGKFSMVGEVIEEEGDYWVIPFGFDLKEIVGATVVLFLAYCLASILLEL